MEELKKGIRIGIGIALGMSLVSLVSGLLMFAVSFLQMRAMLGQ